MSATISTHSPSKRVPGLGPSSTNFREEVTQPRVSDLVRGKIERFSIDTIAMLAHAGIEVTVLGLRPLEVYVNAVT